MHCDEEKRENFATEFRRDSGWPDYTRRAGSVLSRFQPGTSSVLHGRCQKVTNLASSFSARSISEDGGYL